MKFEMRSVFAGLWLLLTITVTFYTNWSFGNTALDISAFYGEGRVLEVSTLGYAIAGYCLMIALFYWYSSRLDRAVLNWLHFLGTVATILMAWYVLVGLALAGGLPGGHYSASSEMVAEIAHQQAQILIMQVRAVIFLFLASQLLFVINLLSTTKDESTDEVDKMLDQLLDND